MAGWDQDIHRIQEIQQLLEHRQRLFCGQLSATQYKDDSKNNPLPFSFLSSKNSIDEHSLGHSLEANFGSCGSLKNETPDFPEFEISDDSQAEASDGNAECDRSSDGHCADQSDNDTTDLNTSEEEENEQCAPDTSRNAKKRRNWVIKNMKKVAASSKAPPKPHDKPAGENPSQDSTSKKGPIPRRANKSVAFEDPVVDEIKTTPHKAKPKKKKKADPFSFVKKRSWRLRAEIVSRLNGDNDEMDLKILNTVTKTTVEFAREKLKMAEKSLQRTVDKEQMGSKSYKKIIKGKQGQLGQPSRPKSAANRTVSRLAVKNSEDAVKSDLNLREVFAMIKIDPNPLLTLTATESKEETRVSSKRESTFSKMPPKPKVVDKKNQIQGLSGFEDPETTLSLNRLTQLSMRHRQRQNSLVPEQVGTLRGTQSSGAGAPPMSRQNSTRYVPFPNRRKSSTASVASQQQTVTKKKSKEGLGGPKLVFSGLEAALKAERKGGATDEFQHVGVEKLTGTVL